jgi:hypothetical protein
MFFKGKNNRFSLTFLIIEKGFVVKSDLWYPLVERTYPPHPKEGFWEHTKTASILLIGVTLESLGTL